MLAIDTRWFWKIKGILKAVKAQICFDFIDEIYEYVTLSNTEVASPEYGKWLVLVALRFAAQVLY